MRRLLTRCLALIAAPFVARWLRRQEMRILREGRPLSAPESALARRVGARARDRIRLLVVDTVPTPGPRWFSRMTQRLGYPATSAVGMSLGHGIYLQRGFENRVEILAHECVHTSQYERLGTRGFLTLYIQQCLEDGYANSALEREAVKISHRACGRG